MINRLTGVDKRVDVIQIFQSLPNIVFDSKIVSHALQLVFRTTGARVKVSHSRTHWSDGVVMGGETPNGERNSKLGEKLQVERNSKSEKFQVGRETLSRGKIQIKKKPLSPTYIIIEQSRGHIGHQNWLSLI